VRSAALTPEQQEILAKRGVLSPDEIHKLAAKTRKAVGAEEGKASCHSDFVDPEMARDLQGSKVVQVNLAPALNLPSHDPII
jgi:phosphomethylpyrimidine synthase